MRFLQCGDHGSFRKLLWWLSQEPHSGSFVEALDDGSVPNQFLEVALYYAEAFGKTSKHQIAEIDLEGFGGEVIDVSDYQGCQKHGVAHHHRACNFATKHRVVMLLGYIHPNRLRKPLHTSELNLPPCDSWPTFDNFKFAVSDSALRRLGSWRSPPTASCRKPLHLGKHRIMRGSAMMMPSRQLFWGR